jgi:hypothetical protein
VGLTAGCGAVVVLCSPVHTPVQGEGGTMTCGDSGYYQTSNYLLAPKNVWPRKTSLYGSGRYRVPGAHLLSSGSPAAAQSAQRTTSPSAAGHLEHGRHPLPVWSTYRKNPSLQLPQTLSRVGVHGAASVRPRVQKRHSAHSLPLDVNLEKCPSAQGSQTVSLWFLQGSAAPSPASQALHGTQSTVSSTVPLA